MIKRNWLGSLLLSVLHLAIGAPREAIAHGVLQRSLPARGAHLDSVPREIRLTFSESVERAFTRIVLIAPQGDTVALGPLTVSPASSRVVSSTITGLLSSGVYTVAWQVAGKDGHPVRGSFQFTIAPEANGLASDSIASAPPHHSPTAIPDAGIGGAFDASAPLFAVIRWLTFMGTFGIVGAAAFRFAVIGRMSRVGQSAGLTVIEPALSRAAVIGVGASILLLLTAAARLGAQSLAIHGSRDAFNGAAIGSMIVGTLWGNAWLLQVTAILLAATGFVSVRRGYFAGWIAVAAGAALLALSLSLSGHAAAVPKLTIWAITADAVHVIGAAGWLGSLFMVVAAGISSAGQLDRAERPGAVAALVNAFSPTALVFAGVAASTGVLNAWLHLGDVRALWTSDYGRTLLFKLGVLSAVVATGAYNWLRVRPSLGSGAGIQRMRRSATAELIVGAIVLAVTAVLVAMPTPME